MDKRVGGKEAEKITVGLRLASRRVECTEVAATIISTKLQELRGVLWTLLLNVANRIKLSRDGGRNEAKGHDSWGRCRTGACSVLPFDWLQKVGVRLQRWL